MGAATSRRRNRLAGLENLLPELRESSSDELPLGTKVFPSTYRYPNNVQAAILSSVFAFFVLLVVAGSESGSHKSTLLAVAFVFAALAAAALAYLVQRSRRQYRIRCAAGTWGEGVFLFPTTGDVVVRLPTLCSSREVSFEKENVQNVYVREAGFLWSQCGGRGDVLVIHHNSGEHVVDAARLAGSARGIADRINEVQRGGSRNIFA